MLPNKNKTGTYIIDLVIINKTKNLKINPMILVRELETSIKTLKTRLSWVRFSPEDPWET